jgi:hypothetical protein
MTQKRRQEPRLLTEQSVGWVELFAKPIATHRQTMMGFAAALACGASADVAAQPILRTPRKFSTRGKMRCRALPYLRVALGFGSRLLSVAAGMPPVVMLFPVAP